MRRVLLTCLVLMIVVPVGSAQDGPTALPDCTDAEMAAARTILEEQQLLIQARTGIAESDITFEDYRLLVADYDALSVTFWQEVLPSMPACRQVYYFGYATGLLIDETLMVVLLRWQALYEYEHGDPAFVAFFTDAATSRIERLPQTRRQFNNFYNHVALGLNLPACEDGQDPELRTLWEATMRRYFEIGALSQSLGMGDLDLLIHDYTSLSLDWREARTDLVTCAESFAQAYFTGYVINETIIVNSLFRIAILEDEFGNRELSDTLLLRGNERLTALLDAMYADPDFSNPQRFEATPEATAEPS